MRIKTETALKEYLEVMDALKNDSKFWINIETDGDATQSMVQAAGDILTVSALREISAELDECFKKNRY